MLIFGRQFLIGISFGICYLLGCSLAYDGNSYQPSSPPTVYIHDSSFHPDRILRVTTQVYPLDCTTRYSVVINGSIPGPELRFREGDKIWIRVYNDIKDENLTIHWHGLTMRMSPFSDGTPAASQWPIPPMHFFDYEFELQSGDAGTYFYHSHVGFGAVTAYGALIIEERVKDSPPFVYDDERTLVLTDIFYRNDSDIVGGLMGDPFLWSGETFNVALNGHSRSPNATADKESTSCSYGVVTVKPSTTYRFRFIGGTVLSHVFLAFEGHGSMTVIEVDGHYVSPVEVDHIEIGSGQRFSVLFKSKSIEELSVDRINGKDQYWLQMETRTRALITVSFAVLAYSDADIPDRFTKPTTPPLLLPTESFTSGWLEDELWPLPSRPYDDSFPQASEVTRRIFINVQQNFNVNGTKKVMWHQNGAPWFENSVPEPYLVSLYKNSKSAFPDYENALKHGGYDTKTKTYPAKLGEVLEIIWQNVGNTQSGTVETHPFHAHGDHYWDAGCGTGSYSETVAEAMLQDRMRYGGPIKRDTTNLYRTPPATTTTPGAIVSWRAWRLRVRNPGVWMVHCHIVQHMMMGMQAVFVFGGKNDLKPLTKEQAALYLEFGGQAYGNATYSPRVVHFWHD
ncbi:L-ascorbate oxidase [Hypsibius exemplaris]|uniref:L-ascorbate oxidase n=1 Tax=Hypsibius exemplaris TaxID=2072580 RepID=A0A1W0X7J5_HYPEX|nr:L-ascorbate oxidase [Hypsibius exemplaris]